ncbi:hypothetical protein NORO109296_01060 [Nocardiopsis rhodophaea]
MYDHRKIGRELDLFADLVKCAENMCVVEVDGPHPTQPAEHARELRPVHSTQLGHAQGKIAVAV